MKSTIVSMLIVLIVLAVLPMVFFGDNDFLEQLGFGGAGDPESLATLKARAPKNLTNVVTDKEVRVYKWVDENGVTQFSQTPPRLGGAAEAITLQPDTNVMQAYKPPAPREQTVQRPKVFKTNPYTPGGMKDMIGQTQAVSDALTQQQAGQKALLDRIMRQQQ